MSADGVIADAVIWHEVECGAYRADLTLWRELAERFGGPVLDVGAGTGRVALDLCRAGFSVTALDRDASMVAELERRAGALALQSVVGDARDFALDRRFALIIVPMQTIQLLDQAGRGSFLACARKHLLAGGAVAVAISEHFDLYTSEPGGPQLDPDRLEVDGWMFSSRPTAVRAVPRGVQIERRREVARDGVVQLCGHALIRLEQLTAATLEDEGRQAELRALERCTIAPTPDHVGSTVVVLGA